MKTKLLLVLGILYLNISIAQTVSTLAGTTTAGTSDGTGTAAQFSQPQCMALDASGNVYVSDGGSSRIRKITPAGVVTTVAGSAAGYADGTGTAAQFNAPQGLVVDNTGNIYVADYLNDKIRKIAPGGVVTTFAGSTNGNADGTGTSAQFNGPQDIDIDAAGNLYVVDYKSSRIRKITPGGVVTTIAGSTNGYADGTGSAAQFNGPFGIATNVDGNLYIADTSNNVIRKITPAGVVSTFVGSLTAGTADGTGAAAQFNSPLDITSDAAGNLYVGDTYNDRIRKITPAGVVTTIAGSSNGYSDGPANTAQFNLPWGIGVNNAGIIYTVDAGNNVIRKITFKCKYTSIDNTWNGSNWSLGHLPTNNETAIIDANYNTSFSTPSFESCNLTVNPGKTLTINDNDHITVNYNIDVKNTGSLVVMNDANLLQIEDSDVLNTGTISAIKNISLRTDRNQYNYLLSPVLGQNLKTIYPNIDYVLYYNEANDNFYTSSGAFIPARGLAVKVANSLTSGSSVNALFEGTPTNGEISFPLAYSGPDHGYNLVGNPYPSNIDLDVLYNSANNLNSISASFYFWDNTQNVQYTQQGSSYAGSSYAIFNAAAGGTGTGLKAPNATGSIQKIPSNNVKVSQGFLVKSLSSNKILTFNNSMRTFSQSGSAYFGKSGIKQVGNNEEDRYYLKMSTPQNLQMSMAVIYFNGGNNSFAADDSEILGNPSDQIYMSVEDKRLVINGKSKFLPTDKILLGTKLFAAGLYAISIDSKEGIFDNGQNIYLKDNQTGITTNLTAGNYTFYSPAGDNLGRFEIVYKPESGLLTNNVVHDAITIYRDSGQFIVRSANEDIIKVEVFDISGKQLLNWSGSTRNYHFQIEQSLAQIFIVRTIIKSGQVITKKIRN